MKQLSILSVLAGSTWLFVGHAALAQVPPAAPAPGGGATPAPGAAPAAAPAASPAPAAEADAGMSVAPAAEASPAPATAYAAPMPPPPPAAEEEPPAALPEKLAVGKQGFIKPGALAQVWFTGKEQDDTTSFGFRLRRMEVKLSGAIIPDWIEYGVMFDLAKVLKVNQATVPVANQQPAPDAPGEVTVPSPQTDYSPLQDLSITFVTKVADISVGQFKMPLSYEGFGTSASKLIFPERSLVALTWGDARDIGIKAQKELGPVNYTIGLFNGSGLNRVDNNQQKDLALRLELKPIKAFAIGGTARVALGERDDVNTRDQVSADARVDTKGLLVQGEYLAAWTGSTDTEANGDRVLGHGFYGVLGYKITDQIQPVARIGMVNRNVDIPGDKTWHYEGGLNYFILENQARLSLALGYSDNNDRGGPANSTDLTLAAQASF